MKRPAIYVCRPLKFQKTERSNAFKSVYSVDPWIILKRRRHRKKVCKDMHMCAVIICDFFAGGNGRKNCVLTFTGKIGTTKLKIEHVP